MENKKTKELSAYPLHLIPNIVEFAQQLAQVKFYSYQIEVSKAIVKAAITGEDDDITILISRQAGKTEVVADTATTLALLMPKFAEQYPALDHYRKGCWIGIFAPATRQVDTTYNRAKACLYNPLAKKLYGSTFLGEAETRITKTEIILPNNSIIRPQPAGPNANIESSTYHIIITDECQDIPDRHIIKSIEPMGSATNAVVIKVGTPNGVKCEFLNAINRNKRDPKRKHLHFEFDANVVRKENVRYRNFLDKQIRKYGKDHEYVQMSYYLKWNLEEGMFITEEEFESLMINKDIEEFNYNEPCVAGIDLAKQRDKTVITVMKVNPKELDEFGKPFKTIINWKMLKGQEYETQFYEIIRFLKNYNVNHVCIDSTGGFDAVADRLSAYFDEYNQSIYVTPVVFSQKRKSELYRLLHADIKAKRLLIPGHSNTKHTKVFKTFKMEMLDLQKEWQGTIMKVKHPEGRNYHDDFPDSLALCNYAASSAGYTEIMPIHDNIFKGNSSTHPVYTPRQKYIHKSQEKLFNFGRLDYIRKPNIQ